MSSQVKRKAAEADDMIRQLAAEAQASESETTESVSDETSAEVVAIQREVEQAPTEPNENVEHVPEPEISHDDLSELKESARKADARWRSLQGQVDSKDKQIAQLHDLLSKMQAAAPVEGEGVKASTDSYTKEDVETYGEDLIDLVMRLSSQVANTVTESKMQPLQKELQSVSSVTASTVQESFEGKLGQLAPNWAKLNEDPDFIDWLQESSTRLEAFQNAAGKRDAVGTSDYFNMYSKLKGLDVDKTKDKKRQLEKQVSPGKARSVATPAASTPPEGRLWTRSEIAAAYSNKGNMSAEEFVKVEREIASAMKDERVDYSR